MLAAGREAGRERRFACRSVPAGSHAEFIPTQAQLDRFLAEGPDPTLRKISVADYWLHYKLMQATGIEKELGGEAQAVEALKSLGAAYERKLRVAEVEVPKMIPRRSPAKAWQVASSAWAWAASWAWSRAA